ncbi:ABC transporter substrate-binding protein, partial [Ursidibacter arcticus]
FQHPEWHQERIGFQPYPFDSYMEKLVEVLKETHISGNNAFLAKLDPSQVARDLNAPQFVKKAVEQGGWLETFNLQNGWTRVEEIAI